MPDAIKRVLVIGAGAGGLAAAMDLASAGLDVTVLEKESRPGGKMRQVRAGSRQVDAGPTVFTMKGVFDALFENAGFTLEGRVRLTQAEVLARHAWTPDAGGGRFDLHADVERAADAVGDFAGAKDARAYRRFCEESADIYRTLRDVFIAAERPGAFDLVSRLGLSGVPALLRTKPFARMARTLHKRFSDKRLAQLFSRYATYCGASPYLAPATLMLVAHVEQAGVHIVGGGMAALAEAMASAAAEKGAQIRYDAPVAHILVRKGRVTGARLESGEEWEADAVVFNGDVSALGQGLLGADMKSAAKPTPPARRSLSALTFMLEARATGFPLHHHTVFFARDYAEEFRAIFKRRGVCAEPTVYVCAADRSAARNASPPMGAERLLLLINAPADGDVGGFSQVELADLKRRTLDVLSRCGLAIDIIGEERAGPHEFERLFPGSGGALYGPANHGPFASFARSGARARTPGLYLCGGSVHPGPGVPMATLSGRIAAARLLADAAGREGFVQVRTADA